MNLQIHSICDVITNSSTTVYMFATKNAVNLTRQAIKGIMLTLGIEGEPEDFFDINLVIKESYLEDCIADMKEEIDYYKENSNLEEAEKIRNKMENMLSGDISEADSHNLTISVKPKDNPEAEDIGRLLRSIFTAREISD